MICGTGPLRDELAAQAAALGVSERVTFAGLVDNRTVARYQQAADLFVIPSELEALPTVAVEALAAGTPVVSTDNPGGVELGRLFGDDVRVVDRSQPGELASAIVEFLAAARRTRPSSDAVLEREFSPAVVAERFAQVYRGVLQWRRMADDRPSVRRGEYVTGTTTACSTRRGTTGLRILRRWPPCGSSRHSAAGHPRPGRRLRQGRPRAGLRRAPGHRRRRPELQRRPHPDGSVTALPWPGGAFEQVLCLDVLEHLAFGEQDAALSGSSGSCGHASLALLSVPNLAHLQSRAHFLLTGRLIRTASPEAPRRPSGRRVSRPGPIGWIRRGPAAGNLPDGARADRPGEAAPGIAAMAARGADAGDPVPGWCFLNLIWLRKPAAAGRSA